MRALALALALLVPASAAAREEITKYKLYCSVETRVAYFATFDSGDDDLTACKTTARMWDLYLESRKVPEHNCWCTVTVSA